MRKFLFYFFSISFSSFNAQNFMWAKQFGGNSSQTFPSAVSSDLTGNVFTTGNYVGNVDFDPGPGTALLVSSYPSNTDIFVSKLNLGGSFVWAANIRKVGGTGDGGGEAICTDAAGNSYITGYFSASVNFEPSFVSPFVMTSFGSTDIFILKLGPSGNFLWAKQMGGTTSDDAFSISVDPTGNVYTTGVFTGTSDFDPGPGVYNLTSNGASDIFVSKLDPSGNFIWAKQIGGSQNDVATSLFLDATLNVCIGGSFYSTVDFDPGPGTYTLTSVGANDGYLLKLDNSGNFVWVKQIAGSGLDNANAMTHDVSGNIYLAGGFNGITDFDPGPSTFTLSTFGSTDIYVSKFDGSGNLIWADQMGGPSADEAFAVTVNSAGEVFTTGAFLTVCDFDPGIGTYTLSPTNSSFDFFISRLNSSGNFVSAKRIGGTGDERGTGIILDSYGGLIITGYFMYGSGVDFDPGPGTYIIYSIGDDGFVCKFSDCTAAATLTVTTSNTIVCSGQPVIITSSGATTYTLFPGGTSGSTQTVNPTVGTIYTLIGTNSASCMDAKTFSISVNPNPTVTTVSSNSLLCLGQTATLTANGAWTYTWSTTSNSNSIVVTPSITTNYTVTGSSSSGCFYACVFTQSVSTCTGLENAFTLENIFVSVFPNL
jgi:hypothetical protein